MVRPDPAVRRLLRETGKLLEQYGFHGSDPTWVRVEPGGVASVGRTRVSRTWISGQQVLSFGLDLNATPTAWWEYCNWRKAQLGLPPVPLEEATGPGLIDTHPLSNRLTTPWSLRPGPDQHVRQADIDAVRAELPSRVHAYARRALRLVEPGRYLEELSNEPDPRIHTLEAVVVLLAERGPGAELDDAIHRLRNCAATIDASAHPEDAIAYARTRILV
ncbi:hypothetical protein ACRS6B_23415 [Nocardia asteroides]